MMKVRMVVVVLYEDNKHHNPHWALILAPILPKVINCSVHHLHTMTMTTMMAECDKYNILMWTKVQIYLCPEIDENEYYRVNTSLWFLNSSNSLTFLNSLTFELYQVWTLLTLNSLNFERFGFWTLQCTLQHLTLLCLN